MSQRAGRRRAAPAASNGHSRSTVAGLTEVVARAVPGGERLRAFRPPSLRRLQRQLPAQAMMATGQLAMTLRRLTGRDVIDIETLQDFLSIIYRMQSLRAMHERGEWSVDDFGFDREFTEMFVPIARLIYRKYWRVETTGLENVPRHGGALLVSNHAGVLPLDGAMIKVAVLEATDRHARALVATFFGGLPAISWFMRRTGQTLGHPTDSDRLLHAGELVLVFPEGVRGTGKPWSERYRLRRFGRGGFVQTAIRSRVPIIPISVVGSEETYPMLADIKPIADMLGWPYFPVTPTWPLLGPLGFVPLPSKWRITVHPPVRTDEMPLSVAGDPSRVMAVSDQVRDTIQAGIVENLKERVRTFRG